MMTPYLRAINELRKSRGSNEKQRILKAAKSMPIFENILLYTYHPTQKYFIKKLPWKGRGTATLSGTEHIWTELLDSSAQRILSGQKQKDNFRVFIESLDPDEANLFKHIVNKDLKAGVSAVTINKIFNDLIPRFGFMKAQPYEKGMLNKPMYMSLKIDCIRSMLRDGILYSSGGNVIKGVQHIAKRFPKDIELDGELTIPGLPFNKASGRLRSNDDCPTALFNVFDMPSVKANFSTRYAVLEDFCKDNRSIENLSLLKHILVKTEEKLHFTYERAIDNGFEGLVLKTPDHHYQLKRSFDWLKMKQKDTEDLPIVGFEEGTGKNQGTCATVLCKRANGVIVGVSNFKEHVMDAFWNNQEYWKGRIIEVDFHEETPDGSLRHPRLSAKFYRHRWDKESGL